MNDTIRGGCLCGAVRYEISGAQTVGGDCYCDDCRRSSGTAFCSHMGVAEDGFAVTGDLAAFAKPADSGNLVTRKFCPTCGSAVVSVNSGAPGLAFVRASSLDDPETFAPQMTVYASRAPSWAPPPAGRPTFPEMPPPPDRPDAATA